LGGTQFCHAGFMAQAVGQVTLKSPAYLGCGSAAL
jgi:hypothetical protein